MTARGPLAGRRIIVTRSRKQSGILGTLLEAEGAVVVEFPTIRIAPPADYAAVDRAIARLDHYQWVVSRGVWHNILCHEAGQIIHITPGPGGDARPRARA